MPCVTVTKPLQSREPSSHGFSELADRPRGTAKLMDGPASCDGSIVNPPASSRRWCAGRELVETRAKGDACSFNTYLRPLASAC